MDRKLDVAIAEALGYEAEYGLLEYPGGEDYDFWVEALNARLPRYSKEGDAILELGEEMRKRGFDYRISTCIGWRGLEESKEIEVVFYKNHNEMATGWRSGKEMPLIFAKQAYWALTGNEWDDE